MKARVAVLTSDKVDYKTKTVIREKEGHYLMIKESIQQKDITFVNMHATQETTHIHMDIKQIFTDLKRKRHQYNNIREL